MSELENIENTEEVEVIPTDNTTEELQGNVEQSTGEVSGEVSAEIEAEQERLEQERIEAEELAWDIYHKNCDKVHISDN